MSCVEQRAGSKARAARRLPPGTTSRALGRAAVAMPALVFFLPSSMRLLPVCLIGPTAIGAVICGLVALRRMRDQEGADPSLARVGIALGTAAIVLPLVVLLWVMWELSKV